MYRIDIIIPTRNRYKKLMRTIESIPGNTAGVEIHIRIGFDGDEWTFKKLMYGEKQNGRFSKLTFYAGHNGAVYIRNDLLKECEDAIIYATDDIVFKPGSISRAIEAMRKKFPGGDGVIGFTQTGNTRFNPGGVALVGAKFLSRYPKNALFYPKLFHFACQEVHLAAEFLKKFYLSPDAIIHHYSPFTQRNEMDQTHADARIKKLADHELIRQRKAAGKIWGIA